jgi:hypothetical protein
MPARTGFDRTLVSIEGQGVEAPADWETLGTAETYAGYGRSDNFASPGDVKPDQAT